MNDDDHVDNERKVRTRNNHNSITNILVGIVLEAYEKIMLGPLNTKVHMNIGFNFLGESYKFSQVRSNENCRINKEKYTALNADTAHKNIML